MFVSMFVSFIVPLLLTCSLADWLNEMREGNFDSIMSFASCSLIWKYSSPKHFVFFIFYSKNIQTPQFIVFALIEK